MNSLNSGHLVDLIGWAVVDEPMTIEARPIDVPDPAASPSPTAIEPVALWTGGVNVGSISYSTLIETGIVLVKLNAARPAASYQELQQDPSSRISSITAITQQQLMELLDAEPAATPCSVDCT